jgi:hypothetical protein
MFVSRDRRLSSLMIQGAVYNVGQSTMALRVTVQRLCCVLSALSEVWS